MTSRPVTAITLLAIGLAGCSSGNLHSSKDANPPPPPPVLHPLYNPNAAYGEAKATWRPPVFDRDGTIQKPPSPPRNTTGRTMSKRRGRPAPPDARRLKDRPERSDIPHSSHCDEVDKPMKAAGNGLRRSGYLSRKSSR